MSADAGPTWKEPVPIPNPIRTWNIYLPATRMRSAAREDRKASRKSPADPDHDFTGQIVIVTGANTGLGYQVALKFASLNAKTVILGVRDVEKGKTARAKILESLGPNGNTNPVEYGHWTCCRTQALRLFRPGPTSLLSDSTSLFSMPGLCRVRVCIRVVSVSGRTANTHNMAGKRPYKSIPSRQCFLFFSSFQSYAKPAV